jgi:hypothetical protein
VAYRKSLAQQRRLLEKASGFRIACPFLRLAAGHAGGACEAKRMHQKVILWVFLIFNNLARLVF